MAKISPVSIKYVIHAKFNAEGTIEKPDVIGAVFGQTEGLLGTDMEMRELQKEGKIGRVDVEVNTTDGKTTGEIEVPSALDKAETTIIAAALETIERIGPSDAKIEILRIEDVRRNKREYIVERAKQLIEQIQNTMPDTREIANSIKESSRISKIQEYGTERLPSGDISGQEVIVVEGRADVVNMIRNGVSNVIAMNGTILPETVKELSYDKTIILFVDGDRGGKLIAKNVIDNARIDFVAIAPDGKEVEELSAKEILNCLRKRMAVADYVRMNSNDNNGRNGERYSYRERERRSYKDREERESNEREDEDFSKVELDDAKIEKLRQMLDEVNGKRCALLLDKDLELIKRVSSQIISSSLARSRKKVYTVVMDGTVIAPIIHAAEREGVKNIVAKNFAYGEESSVNLLSL